MSDWSSTTVVTAALSVYILEIETPGHHEDPCLDSVHTSLDGAMREAEDGAEGCRDRDGADVCLAWKRVRGEQIWESQDDLYLYVISRMEVKPG